MAQRQDRPVDSLPTAVPAKDREPNEDTRDQNESSEVQGGTALRWWTKAASRAAGAAVLAVILVKLFGILTEMPYFEFSNLEVSGDIERIPVSRVREAVEPALTGNYFTVDLEGIRSAVENVPWVRNVVVRRVWPNGIAVEVDSHEALALYEDGRIVSTEGVLFSANPDERENLSEALPNFYGLSSQIPVITRFYGEFSRILEPIGATLTDINYSERGSWNLVISSDEIPPTPIELGVSDPNSDEAQKSLEELVKAYPIIVDLMQGPPAAIDMRYNRAFSAQLPDREAVARYREAMKSSDNSSEEAVINGLKP